MKYLIAFAVAVSAAGIACSRTPAAPSTASNAQSSGVHADESSVSAPVVHITNGEFRPEKLTVAQGSRLTFINDSSVDRWPRSDPHQPGGHNECPEFEAVGVLHPHQTGTTGVLTHAECGFHDHLGGEDPIDGEVRVQGLDR